MESGSWLRLPEGFDRDLKLLLFSMSARRISMGFLGVVRAIYFYLLGFSEVEVGLLLSLATAVSAVHHIAFGVLSDRFGRKPFLVLGGVFSTLRMAIFALSSDFWMLALGQGIGAMGEGAGAGQPVVSGYIADKTDVRERAPVFSALAVANALAATGGALLAGLPKYFEVSLGVDVVAAHQLLFWVGALGGLISILVILPAKDVKPARVEGQARPPSFTGRRSWGVITRFSLVRATSGLGWGFIESLLSLYFFIRFGVAGEVLGPVYAAARFISVFSYTLVPMAVDRFGDISTIVASRLASATLTVAFSLSTSLPMAIALLVAFRIVMMFSMPIRQSFATGIVDPDETATAIGVSNFARMGVRTLAPTAAGYMFEAVSLTMPFLVGSLLLVANGALFWTFFKPREPGPEIAFRDRG
ncbi:MAG: MFS transporter [Candidatus Bathyarchaeota archaeon]|nr:MFS transporter [Candidatus Bathyarchaeota archaeon]